MPAAKRQLWLVALLFVVLGVGVYALYNKMRSGDIQVAHGRKLYDEAARQSNKDSAARKYAMAEAAYERAAGLEPSNADAWYWLGISRKNQGKDKEAADALVRATQLRPTNVNWAIECAEALQWAKQWPGAEAEWAKVVKLLPPEDHRALKAKMSLAEVLSAEGKHDQAINMLKDMLAQQENNEVRALLAKLLAYAGRYEESIEQFRRVVGEQPASKPEK